MFLYSLSVVFPMVYDVSMLSSIGISCNFGKLTILKHKQFRLFREEHHPVMPIILYSNQTSIVFLIAISDISNGVWCLYVKLHRHIMQLWKTHNSEGQAIQIVQRRASSSYAYYSGNNQTSTVFLFYWWWDLFMCDAVHIRSYNVKSHWKVQGCYSTPEYME